MNDIQKMIYRIVKLTYLFITFFVFTSLNPKEDQIPEKILNITQQSKYKHSNWGLLAKESNSGRILLDFNSDFMYLPASTTKLFSVAALLKFYDPSYRFKTPVLAQGTIKNGALTGNLILVAQGDITFGGRQKGQDHILFTNLDHVNANEIPGVTITNEDPLLALNTLAKQIKEKGINEINGEIIIDTSLFEQIQARGNTLSPIMINENLIDIIIDPAQINQPPLLSWRPQVPGYEVRNELKTVSENEPLDIKISADETSTKILVKGTIPKDKKEIIRTFPIKDPINFAKAAFIQALNSQGITIKPQTLNDTNKNIQPLSKNDQSNPIAEWDSPPLSETARLILKVSHNIGADMIPLLLAAKHGKKTFNEGMQILGQFLIKDVNLSLGTFVFNDAAGGNENRVTLKATVQLLDYMRKQSKELFQSYFDSLPILGVDGSLADFAKNVPGAGNVFSKPGTGVGFNAATDQYFLNTQALAGYIKGRNNNLIEYMVVVNNAEMPTIEDIFPIFEDLSQISNVIYEMGQSINKEY